MDCTDIVVGLARGSVSKVYDSYTRDRSTPQPDEFFGGQDDLTAAVGYEEDGETTIAFRKKIRGEKLIELGRKQHFLLIIIYGKLGFYFFFHLICSKLYNKWFYLLKKYQIVFIIFKAF